MTLHPGSGRRRHRQLDADAHGQAGHARRSSTTSSSADPHWRRPRPRTHRLLYATPELTAPLHLSGTPRVTHPPGVEQAGGEPVGVAGACCRGPTGRSAPANLITRGWADPQNHRSLTNGGNYDSRRPRRAARARASSTTLTFDLQPDDQIIPAGKRIGSDDLLERPRLHAMAEAGHGADDRPGSDVDSSAGRRRADRRFGRARQSSSGMMSMRARVRCPRKIKGF